MLRFVTKKQVVIILSFLLVGNVLFYILSELVLEPLSENHDLERNDQNTYQSDDEQFKVYNNNVYLLNNAIVTKIDNKAEHLWSIDLKDNIEVMEPGLIWMYLATNEGVWLIINDLIFPTGNSISLIFVGASNGEILENYTIELTDLESSVNNENFHEVEDFIPIVTPQPGFLLLLSYEEVYKFVYVEFDVLSGIPKFTFDNNQSRFNNFPNVLFDPYSEKKYLRIAENSVISYYEINWADNEFQFIRKEFDDLCGNLDNYCFVLGEDLYALRVYNGFHDLSELEITREGSNRLIVQTGIQGVGEYDRFFFYDTGLVIIGYNVDGASNIDKYFMLTIDVSDGIDVYSSELDKDDFEFLYDETIIDDVEISGGTFVFKLLIEFAPGLDTLFLIYRQTVLLIPEYTLNAALFNTISVIAILYTYRYFSKQTGKVEFDDPQYPSPAKADFRE